MSVSACGMCKGAKWVAERSSSRTCGVMSWCLQSFGPPWTTRWPTATGRCMDMLADCRSKKSECMALRFVNTFALCQRCSVGRTNMSECHCRARSHRRSGQQRLFIASHRGNRLRTSATTSRCSVRESDRPFWSALPRCLLRSISNCESLPYQCLPRERS